MNISPTRIENFLRCEKMYYFRYVEHLRTAFKVPRLGLGSAIANGLAAYYHGDNALSAFIQQMDLQITEISESALGYERKEEYLRQYDELARQGQDILHTYCQWAREHDDFEVLEVETPQSLDMGEFTLFGIPDCVIVKDGAKLCLEHKVRSRYVPRSWNLDLQGRIYSLIVDCMGTLYNFLLYRNRKIDRNLILHTSEEKEGMSQVLFEICRRIVHAHSDPEYIWVPNMSPRCVCDYSEICISELSKTDTQYIKESLFLKKERGGDNGNTEMDSRDREE